MGICLNAYMDESVVGFIKKSLHYLQSKIIQKICLTFQCIVILVMYAVELWNYIHIRQKSICYRDM